MNFSYFFQANISTIKPAIQKRIEKGLEAHSVPEIFQNLAAHDQKKGIEPRNVIIDNRTEEQKEQALMGVEDTSLNDKLLPYKQSPHLLFST